MPEPAAAVGLGASALPLAAAAGLVLAVVMFSARTSRQRRSSPVLIPVAGLWRRSRLPAGSRGATSTNRGSPGCSCSACSPKIFASVLRYRTLVNSYGDVGDASCSRSYGRRYSEAWLHKAGAVAPTLDNIQKSNFLRWFTGVVYYLFGADMIAGFILFGLIAFVGSYLWYRAAWRRCRSSTAGSTSSS